MSQWNFFWHLKSHLTLLLERCGRGGGTLVSRNGNSKTVDFVVAVLHHLVAFWCDSGAILIKSYVLEVSEKHRIYLVEQPSLASTNLQYHFIPFHARI